MKWLLVAVTALQWVALVGLQLLNCIVHYHNHHLTVSYLADYNKLPACFAMMHIFRALGESTAHRLP